MNDTKDTAVTIRRATGTCQSRGGLLPCARRATVNVNGCNLCDYHAEQSMIAACRRDVRIKRGQT